MLPNSEAENLCRLALTFVDGIGPKMARALISHFGSAQEVLRSSAKALKSVGGMGEARARACKNAELMQRAEEELQFVQKHGIRLLFLTDEGYPHRLKHCDDAPLLLYYKGAANPDAEKMIAVIGTRKNTEYGQRATEELIDGLREQEGLVVVSGLAYGIDAIAHRRSLQAGLPTIGVVGHGLDRMYPSAHRQLAKDMLQQGGLLTEFPSGTKPDRSNFPVRNRVVAGLCDVTVIVESDEKGGAMITAYLAASYNREVAAFPGRVYDTRSGGPNKLIRKNIASLITGPADLLDLMNWTAGKNPQAVQQQLFQTLSEEEQLLVQVLKQKDATHADELLLQTGLQNSLLAATLLQLEMMGVVKALPGKFYRMNA